MKNEGNKKDNNKGTPVISIVPEAQKNGTNGQAKHQVDNPTPETANLNGHNPAAVLAVSGTIDERLQKVNQLSALAVRRSGILEAQNRLSTFQFGSDQSSVKITLTDAKGKSFETSNPESVDAALQLLRSRADEELRRVEKQIFEINL